MDAIKTTTQQEFFDEMFETDEEKRALRDFANRRRVVSKLASMRTAKGITQAEFARRAGCTQGTVSKLEAGVDADVTLANIEAYAKSTQSEITLLISDRGKSLADQIKHHALSIREAFMRLVKLAHKDDLIAQGVAKLHAEAFFNINQLLSETAQQLPVDVSGRPLIQIVSETVLPDECDKPAAADSVPKAKKRSKKNEKATAE